MPVSTPPEVTRSIIELRFQGYSIAEIAGETGVSGKTVSRRLNDFRNQCRKVGVLKASAAVEIKVENLFKLAEDLRKTKLSPVEAASGVPVAATAKQLGYKPEDVGDLMRLLVEDITGKGLDPAEFASNAYRLQEASRRLGTTYEDAAAKSQELADRISEQEKRLKEARLAGDAADAHLKEKFDSVDLTISNIEDYLGTRSSLEGYGLSMDDPETLETLLNNVAGYLDDPQALISHYSQTRDAESHLAGLQKENKHLEDLNNKLTEGNNALELEKQEYKKQIEAATILSAADILPSQAKAIADTVKQIALKHGIPRSNAVDKLAKDLEDYYDPVTGLETMLMTLEKRHETLGETVKEQEARKKRLEEEHSNDLDTILSLRRLNQSGVSNIDVVGFSLMMQENNLDAPRLRKEVKRLGGLPQAIDQIRGELTGLEARKKDLELEVETLEKRNRDMQEVNTMVDRQLGDQLRKLTKETRKIISQLDDEILSPETGLRPQAVNLVKETINSLDTKLEEHENEFQAILERIVNVAEEAKKKVEESNKTSFEAGMLMGGLTNLDSVTKLVQGKKIAPNEGLIAVYSLVAALMGYLQRRGLNRCVQHLETFMDMYNGEVGSVAA